MSNYEPVGGKLVTPVTVFLGILVAILVVLLGVRFTQGMGAVSNLNDGYTWGIWVVYDVVIGTGLACGGYVMALLVYVFNKGHYHPLVRPALLASLFGYSLGGFAVMVDLGRWWNFWHILHPAYFNVNSVMFEVAMCIAIYVGVLWIEFAPTFFERFGWYGAKKTLEKVLFVFIALGVVLPSMHQSSLGTLLVVLGNQIDDRWQTEILPLLFLLSAIAIGFSIVIFEATAAAEGFKRPRETHILKKVAVVLMWVLAAYIAIRFADFIRRDALSSVFKFDFLGLMFWAEMALFALPIVLLAPERGRSNPKALFLSAISMILAAGLYRIDAFLVAYNPGDEFTYFPSLAELMITIGMIAFEVLAYIVIARLFPVLHRPHDVAPVAEQAAARS